jgi:hypothetical protein
MQSRVELTPRGVRFGGDDAPADRAVVAAARDEAVVGETPNLAARLQALAEPGSVIIGPSPTCGRR